jgi:hypothetical protein
VSAKTVALGRYDPNGRLWRKLQPLAIDTMPLEVPPPRSSRFGSPLVLSRVHWVGPNSSPK